jgi:putative hemolysin
MGGIATEIIIIIILIVFNGLLAMSEMALVSARQARLQHRADQGDAGARAALALMKEPTSFLSTVQIGITLVGILAGAFGGAGIARTIAAEVGRIPFLAPYSDAIGLGVVVVAIAYLSLIVGELAPKRIGQINAEALAGLVAKPMGLLARMASPAVWLLNRSTSLVLRLLGIKPQKDDTVTEEEIKVLIDQGTDAGVFEESEQEMVLNIFRLGDRRISALMTPRRDITWVGISDSQEEIQQTIAANPHSRLLVCGNDVDDVAGIVRAQDLLPDAMAGAPIDLKARLRKPLFIPEHTHAIKLLEMFRKTGTHLAVVVDEHGGTQGLVTHHDVMEAIVGDIPQPGVVEDADIIRRDDGSWLLDGALPKDELKELLDVNRLPGEETGDYHTVAGMILAHLGHIPAAGEHFVWNGFYFEILDMDRYRIDKVLVRLDQRENTNGE